MAASPSLISTPGLRSRPPSRQAFLEGVTHVTRVRSPLSYESSSTTQSSHPSPSLLHSSLNLPWSRASSGKIPSSSSPFLSSSSTTTPNPSAPFLYSPRPHPSSALRYRTSAYDDDDDYYGHGPNHPLFFNDDNDNDSYNLGHSSYNNHTLSPTSEDLDADYDHILAPGDLIGVGRTHHGLVIKNCFPNHQHDTSLSATNPVTATTTNGVNSAITTAARHHDNHPPFLLEVVRVLGRGSYAVVFLVRHVLYDPPADATYDPLDPTADIEVPERVYGAEYALKCLCKRELTEEQVLLQRLELDLHHSLPSHPNIVALQSAFETPEWLFLLIEYCPGQDLFFWLEQAKDHQDMDFFHQSSSSRTPPSTNMLSLSIADSTPREPSLLSSTVAASLLGRRRLRLISRMFVQICEAVHASHQAGIAHRDIKPENFICMDSRALPLDHERRVVVKLTDWGLATSEVECGDFDCGSKPYMAYECRNNVSPTYKPRESDIWSLGIVLLNLLYHRCPWADPSFEDDDFTDYVQNPIDFLRDRFNGISFEVAEFLATRVFCQNVDDRVTAQDFGRWGSKLVRLMGEGNIEPTLNELSTIPVLPTAPRQSRVSSPDIPYPAFPKQYDTNSPKLRTSTLSEFSHSQLPNSPNDNANGSSNKNTSQESRIMEESELQDEPGEIEYGTSDNVIDADEEAVDVNKNDNEIDENAATASQGGHKSRRKRGARKSKRKNHQLLVTSDDDDVTLDNDNVKSKQEQDILNEALAEVSQTLAREISHSTKQRRTVSTSGIERMPPSHGSVSGGKPAKVSLMDRMKGALKNGNTDLEAFIERAKERDTILVNAGISSAPAKLGGGSGDTENIQSSANSINVDMSSTRGYRPSRTASSTASSYSTSSMGHSLSRISSSTYSVTSYCDSEYVADKVENIVEAQESEIDVTATPKKKITTLFDHGKKISLAETSSNWRQPDVNNIEPKSPTKISIIATPSSVMNAPSAAKVNGVNSSIPTEISQPKKKGFARMLGRSFGGGKSSPSRAEHHNERRLAEDINHLSYHNSNDAAARPPRYRRDSSSTLKSLANPISTPKPTAAMPRV